MISQKYRYVPSDTIWNAVRLAINAGAAQLRAGWPAAEVLMNERILLVDDDHGVLEFCSCLLSRKNFVVTACSTAAEALALMRGGSYDILLTDFDLGDGWGTDLLAFSKQVAPAARALLMTGNAAQHAALKKPFTAGELLSAVSS